ncbi:LacI family DNA-binding transcriptional regulator [Treponema sp. OMZ 840]|uniref:LacI family DNA-binding transcriptional regulator n=1 Tax=Treponema sp. OMZ 840 TaxID=244313 RepID=UPI003D8B6F77
MITIKDVAQDAGVSTATVSRVLNKDTKVSEEKRRAVNTSIARLNYRLYPAARSLKMGKSKTIGVIAPELSNYFFMFLCECFEKVLRQAGYSMILCCSNDSVEVEKKRLDYLAGQFVDGIIAIPVSPSYRHFKRIQQDIPLVLVDRNFSAFSTDCVLVDNAGGTQEAVCALIADGFKRIAFLGGDEDSMTSRERFAGYKKALETAHIRVDERLIVSSGLNMEGGYKAMDAMLACKKLPDAYFCVNLMVTLGAAKRVMEEPEEVQKKIVFAAFDDVYYSSLISWCRYFVAQPMQDIGIKAAEMILERINNPEREYCEIRLPTTLIRR